MSLSVVESTKTVVHKQALGFEKITVLNRLNMEITIELHLLYLADELVAVISTGRDYHYSTIGKSVEQIAFQLQKRYGQPHLSFSIVEYTDRSNQKVAGEEWWQWRFNWVGNTPIDGQRYLLSSSKISLLQSLMLEASNNLMDTPAISML